MKTYTLLLLLFLNSLFISAQWEVSNMIITEEDLKDVLFIDENTGFILAESALFKTIDNGKKWTKELDVFNGMEIAFHGDRGYLLTANGIFTGRAMLGFLGRI